MAYRKRGGGESGATTGSTATAPVTVAATVPTTTAILKGDGFGGVTDATTGDYLDPAAGATGTYTFAGGATGDVASMTFAGGQLTAVTLVP
jgi:hypothetical protein